MVSQEVLAELGKIQFGERWLGDEIGEEKADGLALRQLKQSEEDETYSNSALVTTFSREVTYRGISFDLALVRHYVAVRNRNKGLVGVRHGYGGLHGTMDFHFVVEGKKGADALATLIAGAIPEEFLWLDTEHVGVEDRDMRGQAEWILQKAFDQIDLLVGDA